LAVLYNTEGELAVCLKPFVSDLRDADRSIKFEFMPFTLTFIHISDKIAFRIPFQGVRGNVSTSSIACWKARGRLSIRNN